MRLGGTIFAVLVGALGLMACAGDRGSVELVASGAPKTTATTGLDTTSAPRITTTTTVPQVVTSVWAPKPPTTLVAGPTTTMSSKTTSTTISLPTPSLFDARQGMGTPCESSKQQRSEGCFFFVYATVATKGWEHRIFSDAPFRTDYTTSGGNTCGAAQPHHGDRDGCVFYVGPVHDRLAGQRECFWATTVQGSRESDPSNRVCFTWTDQPPRP